MQERCDKVKALLDIDRLLKACLSLKYSKSLLIVSHVALGAPTHGN